MNLQTQPRVLAGAPTGGEFAVAPRATNGVTLTQTSDLERLAVEFAAIDFGLADSTADLHRVATDPTRPTAQRRTAARAALGKARDGVLHARHGLADDGGGVAGIAQFVADSDAVLDEAMRRYSATDMFEDGDEHLFGVDLAAIVFEMDRDAETEGWARQFAATPREPDLEALAYDRGDPKGMDLDDVFERADAARK